MNCKFWWNETNEMSRNILSSKQNNWQTIFFEYLLAEIISCEACAKKYFSVFVSALKSDASLINVFAKVFGKIVLETQTNSTDLRTKMSQMKGLQCKKTQMYKFLSVWFVCKQCFSRQFILRHDNKIHNSLPFSKTIFCSNSQPLYLHFPTSV